MRIKQHRIFREYNVTFAPAMVQNWEKMVQDWNRGYEGRGTGERKVPERIP